MKKRTHVKDIFLPMVGVLTVLLVCMAMFIYQAFSAALREQIDLLSSSTRYHVGRIDETLSRADAILLSNATQNVKLIGMACSRDMDSYQLYRYGVWSHFGAAEYDLPYISGYFFYSDQQDDFVGVIKSRQSYEWRKQAERMIAGEIRGGAQAGMETVDVDGRQILTRLLSFPGLRLGYWLCRDDLLADMTKIADEGVGFELLTDGSLEDALETGAGQSPLSRIVLSESRNYGVRITVTPGMIWSGMSAERRLLMFLALFLAAICMVWVIGGYVRILRPLEQLVQVMGRIGRGDTTRRLTLGRYSSAEAKQLAGAFNNMMDQLRELQERSQSQEIRLKTSEMERLKLQINPHFFINAMNNIRSFAMLKNYRSICDMSVYLSDYFRFVLRRDVRYVTLGEEMRHTENFIRIQQYRFSDKLQYETNISEACRDATVPILLVHTFVDNAVRYVLESAEARIWVTADLDDRGCVRLEIGDTGRGFDDAILERLNCGESLTDREGRHVGISNLTERMDKLYQGQAVLRFANQDGGGGLVKAVFPYIRKEAAEDVPIADRG